MPTQTCDSRTGRAPLDVLSSTMVDPAVAPVLTGAITTGVINTFLKVAELTWQARRAAKEKPKKADARDAHQLALQLTGSVLFETRSNIERIRLIDLHGKTNGITFGVFDLSITDAVLPELCRVAPAPVILERIRRVVAMVRRVDHYQRLGYHNIDNFSKARAFAGDAIDKGIVERFNELVRFGSLATQQALKGDAAALGFFPTELDVNVPIDHSLL